VGVPAFDHEFLSSLVLLFVTYSALGETYNVDDEEAVTLG